MPLADLLIGRERILADVTERARAGATSGIFGREGVGKTALAAEVVARLAEEPRVFPGGVAWIACEGLEGAAGLAELWTKVARAFHLEQVLAQLSQPKRQMILAAELARQGRVLLALDNVEPGVDLDPLVETLAVRGHATLLLTARQLLPSPRIAIVELAPLDGDAARALFLQCLWRAEGRSLLPAEEGALADLLEALDNVPLAIELTAACPGVRTSGGEQVAREARNSDPEVLPSPDSGNVLRTCMERSWAALPPHAQHLFAGLSLLRGASFPRAAALALAEEIRDDTDARGAKSPPERDLATLVNSALVQVSRGGDRLRLHPLLREYAARKLEALPAALQTRLGNAMAVYWLAYASKHPGSAGMAALEAEDSGLLGAVDWAQRHARYRMVLNLAHALRQAWNASRRHAEELELYAWASSAAQKLGDWREQRWAMHQQGVIQHRQGLLREARASYERALTFAWREGDLSAERDEIYALALIDQQRGRLSEARVGHEQALLLARNLGNPAAEWEGVHALALLDTLAGRFEEARAHYEQALVLARQVDEPAAEAIDLGNLGLFLSRHGERDRGRHLIQSSLEISRRLGNLYDMGKSHQFLAWLDQAEGRCVDALAHYSEALHCFKRVASPEARRVRDDLRQLAASVEVEKPFRPEVVRVVRALVNGNTSWEETHTLLEQEQALLLTDEADRFLRALIEQAREGETLLARDQADFFAEHLFLLRDARASSIQAAWERFEQTLAVDEQDDEVHRSLLAEGPMPEEAARAAHHARFLAGQPGLSADEPELGVLQRHLRDYLAEQQETL